MLLLHRQEAGSVAPVRIATHDALPPRTPREALAQPFEPVVDATLPEAYQAEARVGGGSLLLQTEFPQALSITSDPRRARTLLRQAGSQRWEEARVHVVAEPDKITKKQRGKRPNGHIFVNYRERRGIRSLRPFGPEQDEIIVNLGSIPESLSVSAQALENAEQVAKEQGNFGRPRETIMQSLQEELDEQMVRAIKELEHTKWHHSLHVRARNLVANGILGGLVRGGAGLAEQYLLHAKLPNLPLNLGSFIVGAGGVFLINRFGFQPRHVKRANTEYEAYVQDHRHDRVLYLDLQVPQRK